MICTTCGRDNPSHLTFCQECGQRLAARVAPPTPPIGLAPPAPVKAAGDAIGAGQLAPPRPQDPQALAMTALAPATPAPAPAPVAEPPRIPATGAPPLRTGTGTSNLQRPSAPNVSFSLRAAPEPEPVDEGTMAMVACPLCGSANPKELRFCVTCGHLLASSSPSPARAPGRPAEVPELLRTVPEPPPSFSSAPPPPAAVPVGLAPAMIAPVRVVDVGQAVSPAMQRLCPRCRGASDQAAQFCRFCGASLAQAQSVPLQPSPHPIGASAPVPAPAAVAVPAPAPAPRLELVSAPAPPLRAPAPAVSTSRARLVMIARDGGEGPSYPLGESADIGRSEGNVVVAEDRYISPRHARVLLRGGAYYLRDLDSANGIYVRIPFARSSAGRAREEEERRGEASDAGDAGDAAGASSEQVLTDQDLFLVGQQVLRFEVVRHAEEGFGVASENGTLLFGTPAAPRYGRLSQRTVEGVVRDVFHLRKTETVLGRETGDIVFSDDPFLSRRHAAVRVLGSAAGNGAQKFALADLGSSNGTFLQVREEVRLRPGDHFRIGQQLFRFDS